MEGPEQLRQIVQQYDYATVIDIKDAFHHIHVSPILQQYFGFKAIKSSYIYLGLPFGWKCSPYIFSKTLSIAIRAIRKRWRIKIQFYMDDIILLHQSKETLAIITLEIMEFLQNLGWRLATNKCITTPRMTF
jgi:hypothetical protein